MLLEAEELEKRFDKSLGISGISATIRPGAFAVLGPNGAGKTTFLRLLAGVFTPTRGRLMFNGNEVTKRLEAYRENVGYKPQSVTVYGERSLGSMLRYLALIKGIPRPLVQERVDWALALLGLENVAHRRLSRLSKGSLQRFFLAQTLLTDPDVFVLDEPTQGLDTEGRVKLFGLLRKLADQRIVVFSTHHIRDVEELEARVLVLRGGRLKYLGSPQGLAAQAAGRAWELTVEGTNINATFDSLQMQFPVIIRKQGHTKAIGRIIAPGSPHPDALPVAPSVEDGYLLLTRLREAQSEFVHHEEKCS